MQSFSQDMALPNNVFTPHWLWRDLRAIKDYPLELVCQMFAQQGEMARFDLPAFALQRASLVSDPEWIERVLVSNEANYSKETRAFQVTKMLIGDGLITSQGERWKKHRRLVQPAFHRQWYARFCDTVCDETAALASRIAAIAARGEEVDLYQAALGLTLQVVCRALLGTDLSSLGNRIERALRVLMETALTLNGAIVVLPRAVPTPLNLRANAALKELRMAVRSAVEEARKRASETPTNLIETLLAASRQADAPLTEKDIESEILTILLAGHETTAIAITWTFHFLSRNPEVDQTLAAEVGPLLKGRVACFADLKGLVYTKQVLQESMRLMPPVWAYTRRAEADDSFKNWTVKKGEQMIMSPFLVHRHAGHWPQPFRFDPLRFSSEQEKTRHPQAYFPFGVGARTCIGNMFAMMETQLVLASLIAKFRFQRSTSAAFQVLPSTTLRPDCPMLFSVQLRATDSSVVS